MRRPPHLAVAALALALLAGAALAPVAASPQPTPLCPACGGQFEDAAAEQGVDVAVRESSVLVQVHGNGSATWTVRNRLNATDGFREDPEAVETVSRQLISDTYSPPTDATLREASIEGNVAVIVFHDPDAAERRVGLLVVDYLHDEGGQPRYHVNADLFRVRGPPDTTVTNTPTGAVESGRTATWEGSVSNDAYVEGPDLDGSPYVVFGPASTSDARTAAAVALATLPIVVRGVEQFVLLQTLLFGAVLAPVAYGVRHHAFARGPAPFGYALAALGAVTAAALAAVHGPTWVPGPALFAVGVGLAATTDRVRARRWSPRQLAAAAGAVLVGTFVVLVALHTAVGADGPVVDPVRSTALALPLAALLPLGAALAGSSRGAAGWVAVAVLAFAAVPPALVDIADPPGGLAGGITAMFLFALAVVVPVVGVLVLAVGRTLRTDPPQRGVAGRATTDLSEKMTD